MLTGNGFKGLYAGLVLAILFAAASFATPLLDVYLPDKLSRQELLTGDFDIVDLGEDNAQVLAWPGDEERLGTLGLAYSVVNEDLEAFYRSRLDLELDDMGGYPTFSEIGDWALDFTSNPAYANIVSGPDTIGYTLENRPIWVIKISDNAAVDEDEPEIFLNATIHAREVIVPLVLMNFAELLAENYGTDQRVTDIVNNREIWILPVVNPDGYTYNEETNPNGGGLWRKNKRYVDGTLRGVDLNRNFSYMWGYDNTGSSPNSWSETYRGAGPASEPETQTMQNFVNSRNFVSAINYHSYSNLILYPYGYTLGVYPDNYDIYQTFAATLNTTLGWETGRPAEVLYSVNGDANDWMEGGADNSLFVFVFEVGGNADGFWPPTYRIPFLTQQQEEPLLTFCEIGGDPFVLGPPPVPVVNVPDVVSSDFTVSWTTDQDPHGNDPVAYDVAELSGEYFFDDAESAFYPWVMDGFLRSNQNAHDGNYSYYSDTGNRLWNTMTAKYAYEVQAGDELTFYCWYDMEQDWDYIYVQLSVDGGEYFNLPGNLTTNYDPHDRNLGNGITGTSNGWVSGQFALDDYVGQSVRVRFAHVTDGYVYETGFFVDEISPVTAFSNNTMIAGGLTDDYLDITFPPIQEPEERWYAVRSIDGQGDLSDWSEPAGTTLEPGGEPTISITLTPLNTPIQIPAQGGEFQYDAEIVNNTGTQILFDVWTEALMPNGNPYGPILQHNNLTIPGNGTISPATLTQNVPSYAPAGTYSYIAKVGDYPNQVISMDSFTFVKIANNTAGSSFSDWAVSGWDDETANASVPSEFTMDRAYPNPFNPVTSVVIGLPESTNLGVGVFNINGRKVAELAGGRYQAGYHSFSFDASDLSSGMYFIRAVAPGGINMMQKVVLVK